MSPTEVLHRTELSGSGPTVDFLADFAFDLSLDAVPPAVAHQAPLSILDTVGCIVSGARNEDTVRLADVEIRSAGAGAARVVGRRERLTAEAACRINAFSGDIFELNDLTGGHSGIAVVPAALALAQEVPVSGRTLLEAVIGGVECIARLSKAIEGRIDVFRWGSAGLGVMYTLGAAAASAKILGLNREQTRQALRIGAAMGPWCPTEIHFRDGGTIKPLFFGSMPGSTGITAARYAQAGITGPAGVLDSDMGFLTTIAPNWNAAAARGDLGWFLANPRRKLHACCGRIHSAIDLAIEMRLAGAPFHRARHVQISVGPQSFPLIAKGGRLPSSPNDARFNLEYCVALAMLGADLITPEDSEKVDAHLASDPLKDLIAKIEVVNDPDRAGFYDTRIAMTDDDERQHVAEASTARGSGESPLSDDEVRAKFRHLTAPSLRPNVVDRYIQRMGRLSEADDVSWVIDDVADA